MFFNKPKAKYNIVNDFDNDVFNLYQVIQFRKEEFIQEFKLMPIHESLLNFWKTNKEEEPVKKAIRFVFLSNFTFLGAGNSLALGNFNPKKQLLKNLDITIKLLENVQFSNRDFREFFSQISINDFEQTFIYCDPPYINTWDNYSSSFTKEDTKELIEKLIKTSCKFAISEFSSKEIIEIAKEYSLNVIYIGERQNLKNRRTEVLLTNYLNNSTLF